MLVRVVSGARLTCRNVSSGGTAVVHTSWCFSLSPATRSCASAARQARRCHPYKQRMCQTNVPQGITTRHPPLPIRRTITLATHHLLYKTWPPGDELSHILAVHHKSKIKKKKGGGGGAGCGGYTPTPTHPWVQRRGPRPPKRAPRPTWSR